MVRGVDWIHIAQDADQVAGCCEHGDEPSGCTKKQGIY
jgi:hypothetical protein